MHRTASPVSSRRSTRHDDHSGTSRYAKYAQDMDLTHPDELDRWADIAPREVKTAKPPATSRKDDDTREPERDHRYEYDEYGRVRKEDEGKDRTYRENRVDDRYSRSDARRHADRYEGHFRRSERDVERTDRRYRDDQPVRSSRDYRGSPPTGRDGNIAVKRTFEGEVKISSASARESRSPEVVSRAERDTPRVEKTKRWDARRHRYQVVERVESIPTESSVPAVSQSDLEEKARQRRLAVEEWRRKKAMEANANQNASATNHEDTNGLNSIPEVTNEPSRSSSWNLENDEEEEGVQPQAGDVIMVASSESSKQMEESKVETMAEEDDIDPLDAYMSEITAEVEQITRSGEHARGNVMDEQHEATTKPDIAEEDSDIEIADAGESLELEDILARAAASKSKKKDLALVDHSKVNYEPFRKDFYIEPPELAEMSKEEVDFLRTSLDDIKIRGLRCPKPIKKWTHCGLPAGCYGVIKKLGFEKPFPIQAQAIPAIMSGRDVIGIAKTGSGKTLAFLLPMFRHVLDQRRLEAMEGPVALIMTPTRELAIQIFRECRPYMKALNLRAVCAYGGSPIKDNIAELKRGAEVVVCTPGRMIDLLCANSGRVINLKRVTYLVLDEADRMFDLGFEPQVMKIVGNVRPDRQTLLFSATFPKTMEALARKILTKPLEITVGTRSLVCEDVTQIVQVVEDQNKFLRLLEILGQTYREDATETKALIFVDRQDSADNLLRDLMRRGYYCMSLHGGKDQMDRDSTIADFKSGEAQILIATSVAARGLDVKNLDVVINYDAPNHMEDYVHRVGRTGRAGNKGTAYTFISPSQEKYAVDIAKALMMSNVAVPVDVQKLVDAHMEKVRIGLAQTSSSGFGGKGLARLDRDRELVKKAQKKTYGGDELEEDDEELETAAEEIIEAIESKQNQPKASSGSSSGVTHLALSEAVAASIEASKNEALKKALEAAARINKAQGLPAPLAPTMPQPSSAFNLNAKGHFTAEIEINDYPQKARWMVTRREQISQVFDHTGASVTTKGVYIPPNQSARPGERKLYLLIEAETEFAVERAKTELKRALAEATVLALESDGGRGVLSGRYNVV